MPNILQLMLCRGSHATAHYSMENRHDIHGLCVNSLPAIGAHERQLFDKLLWGLVTSTIFVRFLRLIARKLAELFRFHRAMTQFYEACGIDDVSRGSVSCLLNASFEN